MRENFDIKATVVSNELLAGESGKYNSVFRMEMEGDFGPENKPGRFVNIKLPEMFLRRPISICDAENGKLTIIYKVVGEGTMFMSGLKKGAQMMVLQGLGNGFDLSKAGDKPVLIGGGVGTPPMFGLAKALIAEGKKPAVILGFNTASEIFMKEDFEAIGCKVLISTADGSFGTKGFVTDCLAEAGERTYYYACGPLPMLRALQKAAGSVGELSLEARMGCGFGACVGCSVETTEGFKKVCSDGPVFKAETVKL